MRPTSQTAILIAAHQLFRKLGAGTRPTQSEFDAAPCMLGGWVPAGSPCVMRGFVYGHPEIKDGSLYDMTPVVMDSKRTWAWSGSMFWRLIMRR